jgi:hypothetical protein
MRLRLMRSAQRQAVGLPTFVTKIECKIPTESCRFRNTKSLIVTTRMMNLIDKGKKTRESERGAMAIARNESNNKVVENTVLAKVRGKIALAVTSSGIASTLLDGCRTAHSRFKLPIH